MPDPGQLPRKGGGRLVAFLLLVVLGGGGFYYWQQQKTQAAQQAAKPVARPAVPVSVMTVKTSSYEVMLDGLGTVQPVNTVIIRSRVDGQIEQVLFKEGQTVKEGDLLLRIDARPFKAALDMAQAKLAQDGATLKNATLDLQRYSTLAQQEIASRQKLEASQTAVASGTALLQADQAAVDNAKTQLSYTEIRAPLTGRVGFRQVDAGNIVRANDTQGLLSIVQMDPINVLYTLPENDLATVQGAAAKGPLTVVATVDGRRVVPTVTGRVAVVNNQVDQTSGTVQIKAVFDNKNGQLWPGQSVTTKTRVETLDKVVVIPTNIIQHGPEGLFVWRLDANDTAQPDKIKIRDQDSVNAVISGGLSAGDRLVTDGQLRLRKGVKVEVREGAKDQQAGLGTARAP